MECIVKGLLNEVNKKLLDVSGVQRPYWKDSRHTSAVVSRIEKKSDTCSPNLMLKFFVQNVCCLSLYTFEHFYEDP